MNMRRGAATLVNVCADLKPGEKAVVICQAQTRQVAEMVLELAKEVSQAVVLVEFEGLSRHGADVPPEVERSMLESDVIFGLTRMSMAHTKARLEANRRGARYLSLPDYSERVLASEALAFDFRGITGPASDLAAHLSRAGHIRVVNPAGTDLALRTEGRLANAAPGWCFSRGSLASPPDAEVNIAPLETETEGVAVVDGSIPCPEIGLLDEPVRLIIRRGVVVGIEGAVADTLIRVFDRLGNPRTRIIGELGIGLNPKARLSGVMLEDEGCLGTVHLGIGSNATIGGTNEVPFHLDHVMRQAVVFIDGEKLDLSRFSKLQG